MAYTGKQSSIYWRLLAVAVFAGGVVTSTTRLPAEIILDDFDQPFEIALPHTGSVDSPRIVQSNIGPLTARREIVISTFFSKPTGQVDANISIPSALSLQFDRVHPTSATSAPIIALNLQYFFSEFDVSQGSLNDRVVLDFASLRSAFPLAQASVFLLDASSTFVSQLSNIAPNDGVFRLEFPFDSFIGRGGGGRQLDPTSVHSLYFNITPIYLTDIDEVDFSTAIERIHFTSAIPEPTAGMLACIAALTASVFVFRGRRIEPCGTDNRQSLRCSQEWSCWRFPQADWRRPNWRQYPWQ